MIHTRPAATDLSSTLLTWGPIVAGLAFLFAPSFVDLFRGIWSTDEQAHGPIVLGVSCWLVWRNWPAMWQRSEGQPTSAAGWPVFVIGLPLYAVGRSQEILLFEIGSLLWLLTGILLLMRGGASVKAQWFALFFVLFMIPLPGAIVEAVTMPMKMAVSYAAENILFAVGYPIARSGVVLQIGQYNTSSWLPTPARGCTPCSRSKPSACSTSTSFATTRCSATSRWPSSSSPSPLPPTSSASWP